MVLSSLNFVIFLITLNILLVNGPEVNEIERKYNENLKKY